MANKLVKKWRAHKAEMARREADRRIITDRDAMADRVRAIREKEKIKVVFVLHDPAMWKTRSLYEAMVKHPRFNPVLAVAIGLEEGPDVAIAKYKEMRALLDAEGLPYEVPRVISDLEPDITFYQKPYPEIYAPAIGIGHNYGLLAHLSYGFWLGIDKRLLDLELYHRSAFMFIESEQTASDFRRLSKIPPRSVRVTGVPLLDELLAAKATPPPSPWKPQSTPCKKIIWAPHFTYREGLSWLNFGSFLNLAEPMLALARSTQGTVQWAFKPHPLLRGKLYEDWGAERAEAYFRAWQELPNGQMVSGPYYGLMAHSDAMVHDSVSFTVEYTVFDKPVMSTVREGVHNDMNSLWTEAWQVHEKAHQGMPDIERFVADVIAGRDAMQQERRAFVAKRLSQVNGRPACDNVIDEILNGPD